MQNLKSVTIDLDALKEVFIRFPVSAGMVNAIYSALGLGGSEQYRLTDSELSVNRSE